MATVVNIDSVETADAGPTSAPHKISNKTGKTTATVKFTPTSGGRIRKWIMRYEPSNRNTGRSLGNLGVVCGSGDRCGAPGVKLLSMASGTQVTETVTYPETGPGSDGAHTIGVYAMSSEDGWN